MIFRREVKSWFLQIHMVATILSILQCGLKPVLVEPDIRTYNIDPLKIEEHISEKTKSDNGGSSLWESLRNDFYHAARWKV